MLEENRSQSLILSKKISNLLIKLGVLSREGSIEFDFDGHTYIFDMDAGEVSISNEDDNDNYDISLDPDLPSNSDSVNPGRDYPDWVVYRLSHLYDFLKS